MAKINQCIARTQSSFDNALTLKIFLFQFVNNYVSLLYIGLIKGQVVGTPNHRVRFMGYRQEEGGPEGCFMELVIQVLINLSIMY